MAEQPKPKDVFWVASSKDDISRFPDPVRDTFGHALWLAQQGDKHDKSKPMKGFGHAGVLEVTEDNDGDTYRAVYTVKLKSGLYVLHCFQKKSKKGISTPQRDIDLIKKRLRAAETEDARLQAPKDAKGKKR